MDLSSVRSNASKINPSDLPVINLVCGIFVMAWYQDFIGVMDLMNVICVPHPVLIVIVVVQFVFRQSYNSNCGIFSGKLQYI